MAPSLQTDTLPQRNLLFFQTPSLWPLWPLVPLVKRNPHESETLGVLIDVQGIFGNDQFAWTVFLDNVFCLPAKLSELKEIPQAVFASAEGLFASGWRVD